MKKMLFLILIGFSSIIQAQEFPVLEGEYLGQTLPGNTPKIFKLAVRTGCIATERIAISPDGKEIFYEEIGLNGIPGGGLKYYRYVNNKWNDTITLFKKGGGPSISPDGKKMFLAVNGITSYSVKEDTGWSEPTAFNRTINNWHYLQETNSGILYAAMENANGKVGGRDWSRISINNKDTIINSLGLPINTTANDADFCVAKDESFMIIATRNGLCISYHKLNGDWSNPKPMGNRINLLGGNWGPNISFDNKYLFYSHTSKSDYSDACTYWVRIDNIVDSLKTTNYIPFLKKQIQNQTASTGKFFSIAIPDSTFIDDDGNNTLTYSATLNNGNPLPSWLHFDPIAKTFSGIPDTLETFLIKVTVTDAAKVSVYTQFALEIKDSPTSINQFDKT